MTSHLIDDEVLIISDGGEMPEVTLHNCLYFLEADPEGPKISLSAPDIALLKRAVVEGYRKIILRDLTLENRDKGLYRGLARAAVNWQRMARFCKREGFDTAPLATEVCARLHHFLAIECAEVAARTRPSCINCSRAELLDLFKQLGMNHSQLPEGWERLLRRG